MSAQSLLSPLHHNCQIQRHPVTLNCCCSSSSRGISSDPGMLLPYLSYPATNRQRNWHSDIVTSMSLSQSKEANLSCSGLLLLQLVTDWLILAPQKCNLLPQISTCRYACSPYIAFVYSLIFLCIYSPTHPSFVHLFIISSMHAFICSLTHLSVPPSIVHTINHSIMHVYNQSFIHSIIHLFIHAFIHSFNCSFTHAFTHSIAHQDLHRSHLLTKNLKHWLITEFRQTSCVACQTQSSPVCLSESSCSAVDLRFEVISVSWAWSWSASCLAAWLVWICSHTELSKQYTWLCPPHRLPPA